MSRLPIVLFSAFLALLSFELFLEYSPFSKGISPVEFDEKIGMWHKRDFTNYMIKDCYKTKYQFDHDGRVSNGYNYNDKVKDIAIVGDSYVAALMVQNKNIVHNQLQNRYQGKYNFLNYGLSGANVTQQYVIIKEKIDYDNLAGVIQFISIDSDLLEVDPKYVDGTNRPKVNVQFRSIDDFDVTFPRRTVTERVRDFLGDYEIYLFLKKLIYFFKTKNPPKEQDKSVAKVSRASEKDLSKNWLQIKGAIYQTQKLLRDKGIGYFMVVVSKQEANRKNLIEFLRELGIPYLDLITSAKTLKKELRGFPCDGHWNDQTHVNIAKIIQTSGLLEQ